MGAQRRVDAACLVAESFPGEQIMMQVEEILFEKTGSARRDDRRERPGGGVLERL